MSPEADARYEYPRDHSDAPSAPRLGRVSHRFTAHLLILLVFFVAVLATTPNYLGDTVAYVGHVLAHASHSYTSTFDPLWEFGHLLWRPLGFLLLTTAKLPLFPDWGLPDGLLLVRLYIAVSVLAAAGLAIETNSLALRVSGSRIAAAAVTLGILLCYSVLNYAQTGNAYIVGLYFSALTFNRMYRPDKPPSEARAIWCGVAFATSALFWFPFLFAGAGLALIPLINASPEQRVKAFRASAAFVAAVAVVLVAAYGTVIAGVLHIQSGDQLKTWIMDAGHGLSPNNAFMRMVFAIPRTFIAMGDWGKVLKSYIFRDPYNQASIQDVVLGILPVVLFYVTMALIVWSLLRTREGRGIGLVAFASAAPLLCFAVFIFEAGSPERYLPIVPMLACAAAFAARRGTLLVRGAAALLLAVILFRSTTALSFAAMNQLEQEQENRIAEFAPTLGKGFITVVSNQDKMMLFSTCFPFHRFNQPRVVPIHDVIEVGNVRVTTWRKDFAARALQTMDSPADVWVSKRLTAQRPEASWRWVEGDDPRVHWKDLPQFFTQFEYDRDSGGPDGFLMLRNSEKNRVCLNYFAETERTNQDRCGAQ
jgi:hypothetical protein